MDFSDHHFLFLIYLAISSLYIQIYLGHPWGNKPLSDNMLWLFAIFMFMAGLGLSLFFTSFQLLTKMDEYGIYYMLKPFQRKYKLIKWSEISKAYIRKYRPILEYGGGGYVMEEAEKPSMYRGIWAYSRIS